MNEKKLDALLDELKRKESSGGFVPAESFKTGFFERTRAEQLPVRRAVSPVFRIAAAAAVLAVIAAVLAIPSVQRGNRGLFIELEARLHDTLPLFGGDKGIGFAGDKLLSFDRSSKQRPDRFWLLTVFDRENRPLGSFAFALGGNEFASLDSSGARGEFLTARTADGSEILKADLMLQLADGSTLKLQDTMVGNDGMLSFSSASRFHIERTLIKLNQVAEL